MGAMHPLMSEKCTRRMVYVHFTQIYPAMETTSFIVPFCVTINVHGGGRDFVKAAIQDSNCICMYIFTFMEHADLIEMDPVYCET